MMACSNITLLCIVAVVLLARPAVAFGAGDIASISKIEGQNWRHGDLENVLLTLVSARAMNGGKKFSSLDVKRIYFGNWLRDYSQAVDIGTVKHVSAEAIRIVLWILGFMSFGYGSKEFEVTTERLGCYRPEEHIDNPKDYAENEDARQYDRRLRGPVNERKELAIDPETGMKAYIASENLGIMTSATLVRKLYSEAIERGRRYARSNDKADKYEAYRLLGTANHCLEDFSAHSNYVELALIEMGERDVFPHVGRNCEVGLPSVRGSRAPLITGTFGGVDFLHSVCGEFDDKATQSEIQELEGTLQNAQNQGGDQSALQDLLNSVPSGLFGGKDEAGKADELKQHAMEAQMNNTQVTPREPEEWLQYIQDVQKQIYPIIEWHDEIMQSITETIDKIPILPDVLEKVTEHVNMYVFSLMAPFVLPIIQQIKNELNAGSGAIIGSSESAQHVVFNDPDSSDPTHSMLSKDHFSNVLNEPAGKVAGEVLRWVVPMIVECWDNEDIDVDRTINRIIRGVLHHPALRREGEDGASDGRQRMFAIVEKWWSEQSSREQDSLREQLSRDGVQEGRNHKPGVKDHGHGSCKPLGMPTPNTSGNPSAPGGIGPGSGLSSGLSSGMSQAASEAVGGGALGSLVGGLAGAVGGGIMAGITSSGNEEEQTQSYGRTSYGDNGSRTQTYGQVSGRQESGNYGRSEYSRTEYRYGQSESYSSYSQNTSGGHPTSTRREEHSSFGGSEPRRYENESTNSYSHQETPGYGDDGYGSQRIGSRRNDDDNEGSNYGRRQQDTSYGRGDRDGYSSNERQDDDNERLGYGQRQQQSSYGRGDRDEYSSNRRDDQYRQDNDSYGSSGRYEGSSYGRQQESSSRSNRDEYQSGGYGRSGGDDYSSAGYRQRDNDEYNSGSGGRRNDNEEMPGGFGVESNESSAYGHRRGDNDDDEDEYSRRRGYGY